VTVQAQIIRLILELKREFGMAVLFVSHDLGVMASICDRVAVMYRGRIVESASSDDLFRSPGHPYTKALLRSSLLFAGRGSAENIGLSVQEEINFGRENSGGCSFYPRCPEGVLECQTVEPPLTLVPGTQSHWVACIRCEGGGNGGPGVPVRPFSERNELGSSCENT
jgi:oligopeptide/dipeptide ABC transporter ATP-binding protein